MPDKMAGKLVTPSIASARNQWYSKDSFKCPVDTLIDVLITGLTDHHEMTVVPINAGKFRRHLGHSKDWIIFKWVVKSTCNIWRNVLSCICRIIKRHFKRYVDTLIKWLTPLTQVLRRAVWRATRSCTWSTGRAFSWNVAVLSTSSKRETRKEGEGTSVFFVRCFFFLLSFWCPVCLLGCLGI